MTLSAVVLTHNNESTIDTCLRSLFWVDELIIIDDYSEDDTLNIIKSIKKEIPCPLHIVTRSVSENYAEQRNEGIDRSRGDWVLFIDADEFVPEELKNEIQKAVKNSVSTLSGYRVKRIDFFLGKWLKYGEVGRVRLIRLGRKEAGKWKGHVHEVWDIRGNVSTFHTPLCHTPHPTISSFLVSIDKYTSILSNNKRRKTYTVFDIIAFPIGKFFQNYLLYQGFRDGIPGLILAVMMSIHSFLVRAKAWQIQHI